MADTPARLWPAIELRLTPPPSGAASGLDVHERLALTLDGLDATAIEQTDTLTSRIYFADAATRLAASGALERELGGLGTVTLVDVADEGWLQKVEARLEAVAVGRFVVAPPWDMPPDAPGTHAPILIVIEPSMGFGTGHHESTRLCLQALETLDVRRRKVLDVGTGSGVLAIAAAKLGAADVLAIDLDPDAVASAQNNVERNDVSDVVRVRHAQLAAGMEAVDVVLANLTAATLVRHGDVLTSLLAQAGTLVTSGFTGDQLPMVTGAFSRLALAARHAENGWECAVFRRA